MVDDDDYNQLREQVSDLNAALGYLIEFVAEHMTEEVLCTCGFGGEHHELKEGCQRNYERNALIKRMDYR